MNDDGSSSLSSSSKNNNEHNHNHRDTRAGIASTSSKHYSLKVHNHLRLLSIFDPSAHLVQAQRKSMFRSRLLFCRPMRNLLRKGKPHAPFQVDPQPATTCCVGLLENGFFAKTQSGNIASQQNFHTISNVTRFGHTWFEPTPAQVRMQPEQTRLFGSVIKKRKKKMNKHKLRKLRRKLRRKKNG